MKKDNYFDDDFEVIYDALDELDGYIDLDNDKVKSKAPDIYDNNDDFDEEYDEYCNDDEETYNSIKGRNKRKKSNKRNSNSNEETDKSTYQKRKKGHRIPNFISPASKVAKTGGKAVYRIVQTIFKTASLILIATIIALLAVNFWNGHSLFGNLAQVIAEKNYALGAYTGVAAFLILFEVIAFFWTLSGQKIQEGRRVRKLDTGRGMSSFLFIYVGSYISNLLGNVIPETPRALYGLKGAITVYGSLNDTLLILCTAGIIICLVRKFIFH